MPIYEYRCASCQHRFEKLVKLNASTPPCPECDAEGAEKLVSASSFVLKGGGWYKDHYGLKRSPSASNDSGSSNPSKGESASPSKASRGDGAGNSKASSSSSGDSA